MTNLTYLDFAKEEFCYLVKAYQSGMRYNPMVAQAQITIEYMMKYHLGSEAPRTHNIRALVDELTKHGIDTTPVRSQLLVLNNFYTHTRYPGNDAYIADAHDIEVAYNACVACYQYFINLRR